MEDNAVLFPHEKEVAEGYAWICDNCGAKYRLGEISPVPTVSGRIRQDRAVCRECRNICRNWELINRRTSLRITKEEHKARDRKTRIAVTVGSIILFLIYPGFITYGIGLIAVFLYGFLKYESMESKLICILLFGTVSVINMFTMFAARWILLFVVTCVLCGVIPLLRLIWDREN